VALKVPNENWLNLCLHPGAVFYIQERGLTSQQPHYFVILNHCPKTDETLLLVVSSSQIENTKKLHAAKPPETLVKIAEHEYADFTKDSIISCNQVFTKTKAQLLQQINNGGQQKQRMPEPILEKLRNGVLASPTVERWIKKILQPEQE
jgi:hypothetical protein